MDETLGKVERIDVKKNLIINIILGFLIVFGLQFSLLTVLAFLILVYIIFTNDIRTFILYFFFLLPFSGIFKINFSMLSFLNLALVFAVMKLLLQSYKSRIKYNKRIILLFLAFGSFVLPGSLGGAILDGVQIVINLIFVFIFLSETKQNNYFKLHTLFYALGIIFSSTFALFRNYLPALDSILMYATTHTSDEVIRFSGLINSSNFYSFDIIIVISCVFVLYYFKKINISFFLIAIPLTIFGLMSISKSFLITLLFLTIYYILVNITNIKSILKTILTIMVFAFLIYNFISDDVITAFIQRIEFDLSSNDLNTITSNRTFLYDSYISLILSDIRILFVGLGLSSDLLFGKGSHNTYIDLVYYFGLIGSFIYVSLIISLIRIKKVAVKFHLISYLPLLVFMLRAFAINLIFRDNIYFLLILIGESIYLNKKQDVLH